VFVRPGREGKSGLEAEQQKQNGADKYFENTALNCLLREFRSIRIDHFDRADIE
jgi:hypothetical protein